MRLAYYIRHLGLTGGTRIAALHAAFLREMGHEAVLATRHMETGYAFPVPVTTIGGMDDLARLDLDAIITCKPQDCLEALTLKGPRQVFFCQGYDIAQLDEYFAQKAREPKYAWWGGRAFLAAKHRLKARAIHKVFGLPTIKWVVSPHIADIIRETYGQPSRLIRNCIDPERFFPDDKSDGPARILSVGDYRLARKNIPAALEAVRLLKKTHPVHFIRVSPHRIAPEERASGVVDEAFEGVTDAELARLVRTSHILLSSSTEEGFGLPPVEAMASGTLAVLADIPAYRHFHVAAPGTPLPYARHFPPTDPAAMADALRAAIDDAAANETLRAKGLALASHYLPAATKTDLRHALEELGEAGERGGR